MSKRRLTLSWLLLAAATLFSIELARGLLGITSAQATGIAVLVIAFVKVRIVGFEFMELRRAPLRARIAFDLWAATLCLALITLYRHR